ncbi:hypothetical protein [Sinorhizobium fredii]|uniref:hypothetical protein n=1 Tax=Rhizobium fredii TaxID=380 RepID=UPI00055C433A|nr:hypothetical protein [Sinorhizobium fredii]
MTDNDQQFEYSEFSGEFIDDDVTVILRIYRPAVLKVCDEEGNTTVWNYPFDTDREAFEEFLATVQRDGIRSFLDEPVQKLY